MGILETIVYGVLQGLTEFLPISSSGHLAVLNLFITRSENMVFFFVILHLGTFLSILVFFFSDIINLVKGSIMLVIYRKESPENLVAFRLFVNIVFATFVTGILVLPFKDFVEGSFNSLPVISVDFLVTGVMLFSTLFFNKNDRISTIKLKHSLFIGIAQAIAVLPGISRSGATISSGIFSGLDGGEAFRFSFLLALPAILGATLLEMPEAGAISGEMLIQYLIGFLSAFFSGLISLKILNKIINRNKFYYFSFYCFLIGITVLIYIKITGIY